MGKWKHKTEQDAADFLFRILSLTTEILPEEAKTN